MIWDLFLSVVHWAFKMSLGGCFSFSKILLEMKVGLGKGCLSPDDPTPRVRQVKAGVGRGEAGGDTWVWDLSKREVAFKDPR